MSLHVCRAIIAQVEAAAEKAFPEECCGFLIGRIPEGFERLGRPARVEQARPLPNGWESSARTHRYQIDPRDFAATEAELTRQGLGILGFYHSHPNVPAWPSPFDLEGAWPCYSYWIICVREGKAAGSRSWMRNDDGTDFHEEKIIIQEPSHEHSCEITNRPARLRGATG